MQFAGVSQVRARIFEPRALCPPPRWNVGITRIAREQTHTQSESRLCTSSASAKIVPLNNDNLPLGSAARLRHAVYGCGRGDALLRSLLVHVCATCVNETGILIASFGSKTQQSNSNYNRIHWKEFKILYLCHLKKTDLL